MPLVDHLLPPRLSLTVKVIHPVNILTVRTSTIRVVCFIMLVKFRAGIVKCPLCFIDWRSNEIIAPTEVTANLV